uniref:prolyl 4-hydroxylase subunit alpha-1-like n=1 Tax=Styela clava TaxID=7725 RepID=UPI001939B68F|nr:prolyl 4-hydroxylase subunit alpha-1-like [Styela clava]
MMLRVLLVYFCLVGSSLADWYSSIGLMEELLHRELDLLSYVKEYISEEERKLSQVKSVVDGVSGEVGEALTDVEEYLGHPVNQYALLKRLNLEFEMMDQLTEKNDAILEQVLEARDEFPNENDLKGSAKAILRLQKTYKLDANQIAAGVIKDSYSGRSLSADDCYKIGLVACGNKDYQYCASWLEEAYTRIMGGDASCEWSIVLRYLASAYHELGKFDDAVVIFAEVTKHKPNDIAIRANYEYYKDLSEQANTNAKDFDDVEMEEQDEGLNLYERLCREGGDDLPKHVQKQLKCYYWNNNNPYLRLQRLKMEELWNSPHIVRFYDIIFDKEIEVIKNLSKPNLDRATVHNPSTGALENVEYRVSKTAWLEDSDHEIVRRVSERISMVTGLSMTTSESLQISNYGVGGQYEPHTDFSLRKKKSSIENKLGHRMATVLFYLSNVEQGGATVFLDAKIAVYPIKGSAVFWYNLYPSGEGDGRTVHAACPVLTGVKWVANKWIHEYEQELRRPCKLDENADNRIF